MTVGLDGRCEICSRSKRREDHREEDKNATGSYWESGGVYNREHEVHLKTSSRMTSGKYLRGLELDARSNPLPSQHISFFHLMLAHLKDLA